MFVKKDIIVPKHKGIKRIRPTFLVGIFIFFSSSVFAFNDVSLDADPHEKISHSDAYHSERSTETLQDGVDLDDLLCADMMVMVFHAYIQAKNHEEFNLKHPTVRHRFLLHSEHHSPIADPKWDNWKFQLLHQNQNKIYNDSPIIGFVAFQKEQKKIVVVYRGSQEIQDWFGPNLNITKTSVKLPGFDGKVHSGYWKVFENSKRELTAYIYEFLSQFDNEEIKGIHLLITGHSLGGAVATLAASYLYALFENVPIKIDLRTFGAPRIAGIDFKNWVENRIIGKRFVRETDPVTKITPWFLGYTDIFPAVTLPSFGAKSHQFNQAHDVRLYQRAIYDKLNLEYKNMYTKESD